MNLRFVSLTGADDAVDIKTLEALSVKYPLFECAILMFPQSEGQARNPSKAWREAFYQSSIKNKALHLCGTAINQLAQKDEKLIEELVNFQRVQINLKPQYANAQLIQQLRDAVKSFSEIEFITQHNDVNTPYYHYWNDVENHSYLYDASLGKGVAPMHWQPPIDGKRTGYAGGLNPDNLKENMDKIYTLSKDTPIWIDMESGVRTDNQFDLSKARYILDLSQ